MPTRLFHVDAFAAAPFEGNPAAVCLLDGPREAGWMQKVAAEMNLSETAFLLPEGGSYRLRWFTSKCEVKLCGHATLASAHALWEEGLLSRDTAARFDTLSGRLSASLCAGCITLDFPTIAVEPCPQPAGLAEALKMNPGSTEIGGSYVVALFGSEAEVRGLRPDFAALRAVEVRAVIATAPAETTGYDFVSRFFAPKVGIDEDPVTGSAHCRLAPFWASRLGKTRMRALQVSARGGSLDVRLEGERVLLGGTAVTVARGELLG